MTGKDAQPLCQGCWSRGGQEAMPPPPDFGRSVNPFSTREADYAHYITTCPSSPPEFWTFLRPCMCTTELYCRGGRPPLTRACKNPFWQGKVKAMAFIGVFYLKAHNLIFSQNMKCSESGRYNKNYNLYSF